MLGLSIEGREHAPEHGRCESTRPSSPRARGAGARVVWARGDRVGRKGVRVCVCVGKQRRRGQLASKLHMVARRVGWKKKSPHTTPPKTCPTRAKRGLPGPRTLGDPEPMKCGCGVGILLSPSLVGVSCAPHARSPLLVGPSIEPSSALENVALFQDPCSRLQRWFHDHTLSRSRPLLSHPRDNGQCRMRVGYIQHLDTYGFTYLRPTYTPSFAFF